MDKKSNKKVKKTSIGGQAVIEGVMMRGRQSMATAVRDGEGNIQIESKRLTPPDKKPLIMRLPIIRGIISFFDSLVGGTKTLMRSASVFGDEGEPSKFEKWLAEKLHVDLMGVVGTVGIVLGLALSVLLFVMLPQWATNGLNALFNFGKTSFLYNLIEGLIRIAIFVCYILLTSLMPDIKRTYMYHGAEHKTITCYEKGLELTPENAKKCRRVHDRCGTTFLFFVMLVSILVFSIANSFLKVDGALRILLKIALLPIVAGLSYELLRGLAKTNCFIFYPLKAPGLLLQHITTREPDEQMLEVAIAAFKTVLEMDGDETIPTSTFITAMPVEKLVAEVENVLKNGGVDEKSDAEWIVCNATGLKRSELEKNKTIVQPTHVKKAMETAKERAAGRPLWYIIGDTDFYGYTIKVDERVLIPRPETEELVAFAAENIKSDDKVLDLCTGSGAIAIALKLKTGATVTASDISDGALELATENAAQNKADITFINSNMFGNVTENYDVIVSNPPYIPTQDINGLEKSVKDYEPKLALDGGADGLDYYKIIAVDGINHLNAGGKLFLEVGIGQANAVKELLEQAGFINVEIRKDISGVERMIKAEKTA